MVFITKRINNSNFILPISIYLIFNRKVNNLSLNIKSSSASASALPSPTIGLDQNIPGISTKFDDVDKNTQDAIKNISDNSPKNYKLNVKLNNDNDSLESNVLGSKIASKITDSLGEISSQIDKQMEILQNHMALYINAKLESFMIIDDLHTTINLLEDYMLDIKANIVEVELSLFPVIPVNIINGSNGVPRLMSDTSSNSESSRNFSDIPELNNSELPSNSFIGGEPNTSLGMVPLNNDIPLSDITYSNMERFDFITHNNYTIHMIGKDNIDYRMAYEYLIECLNNLDKLIAKQQTLAKLENIILPLDKELDVQASIVGGEISSIIELLCQFN